MRRQLAALQRSGFRSKFRLKTVDRTYIVQKGMDTIADHARQFVDTRVADAFPKNDGRQTPMRGHPVFIAQHATATCCRKCMQKWHGIKKGRALNETERTFVRDLIMAWIERQLNDAFS
ncbi:MAG: DUF4186 domain-containing protein [Deltaproteobacteria bacterium]|nr:MAG: DUF4186 domain-containing protein [Deltaproteobacteria bacterium]